MPVLKFIKIILFVPFWFVMPCFFRKKNNIPKGRVIFVCRHTSHLEPILIEMSIWRNQYFLGKKELFKNSLVAWLGRHCGVIPIDRGKPDLTAIKQCIKVLNSNEILTIFPEGTRNKSEEMGEIKNGTAMIAIKTKSPIVPITFKKTPKVFRLNSLEFGEAFTLEEFYGKKLDKETLDKAAENIALKLRGE